ncbi:site-specific DNA-methyltransferase [Martelella lutilitoris]|uniref:Methyltransferase n=1 Tax=Martelella lutilitoris TaxID=2583532 RepID=A0A7T7HHN2_9HYPH|nr:site-specific DNA-methyltransferase [Martelella lutilitoris]QQM29317.1 site-specific DNA-methyltransferase [Martelella lutilitoris]
MENPTEILDGRVRFWSGDCIDQLNRMEPDSVDCVVTSPPYWGLRDYGVEGQIGLEPTLGEHLEVMVAVFEAVRRVLKPTGTLWLNYGDCYATAPNGRSAADTKAAGTDDRTFRDKPFSTVGPIYQPISNPRGEFSTGDRQSRRESAGRIGAGGYLKPKDLCMVPNRLAIALQEAGWWVRSEIIWAKPNPMPESISDRPATSHEKVFLLSKSARYWYDREAVRQNAASSSLARWSQDIDNQEGSGRANGGTRTNGTMKAVGGPRGKVRASAVASPRHAGQVNHTKLDDTPRGEGRNLRNYEPAPVQVWPIATKPFSEAHFATFPPELAERCILAGCPKGGLVLDPFGGAGTTALVALRHGRRADLIELNPEYVEIAKRRINNDWKVVEKLDDSGLEPLPMFAGIGG